MQQIVVHSPYLRPDRRLRLGQGWLAETQAADVKRRC